MKKPEYCYDAYNVNGFVIFRDRVYLSEKEIEKLKVDKTVERIVKKHIFNSNSEIIYEKKPYDGPLLGWQVE